MSTLFKPAVGHVNTNKSNNKNIVILDGLKTGLSDNQTKQGYQKKLRKIQGYINRS